MLSPASGRVTADLILQGHSDLIDAKQLSVERFMEGKLLEETAILWDCTSTFCQGRSDLIDAAQLSVERFAAGQFRRNRSAVVGVISTPTRLWLPTHRVQP